MFEFDFEQGILLVYDITNEKSFENIKVWIRNIEQHASADVEKMILGNKCDMEDKRKITFDQGKQVHPFVLVCSSHRAGYHDVAFNNIDSKLYSG